MKKSLKFFSFVLCLMMVFSLALMAGEQSVDIEKEKTAIKKVIVGAYQEGLCNTGDIAAVDKGFHPGFNLLILQGDSLQKFPIYNWKQSVERGKKAGKFPPKEKVSFKFPMVDVIGTAAMAKVEFYKGEKLTYTDYLSLYKFNDHWKIVAKIYYKH